MENNDVNKPHVRPGDIKYTKGYKTKVVVSKIIKILLALTLAVFTMLSVYLYITQPVLTDNGYINAEITYKMYNPNDDIIFVETDSYNMFTPIQRSIVKQKTYNAKIIAGPYGQIKKYDDNRIKVIHGESVITVNIDNFENLDNPFLDQQYVIRKINKNGEFDKDEPDRIVTKDEILGFLK